MNFYYDDIKKIKSSNRYIFFKDQEAVNNVLDIEINLRNYPNIKCYLVIDQNQPVSILQSKIPETLEKFHKLSGVSYPKVYNLSIKRDNKDKIIPIDKEYNTTIEKIVKPGDILSFDLQFKEIWLDVNLINVFSDKNMSLDFEIKINLDKSLLDLVCIIIKLAIKSFYINRNYYGARDDYFILDAFQMYSKQEELNVKDELLVNLHKGLNKKLSQLNQKDENKEKNLFDISNINNQIINDKNDNTIFSSNNICNNIEINKTKIYNNNNNINDIHEYNLKNKYKDYENKEIIPSVLTKKKESNIDVNYTYKSLNNSKNSILVNNNNNLNNIEKKTNFYHHNSSYLVNNMSPDKHKKLQSNFYKTVAASNLEVLSKTKLRNVFTFNSKIECTINYANLNNIILEELRSKNFSTKRISKNLVDKYLKNSSNNKIIIINK